MFLAMDLIPSTRLGIYLGAKVLPMIEQITTWESISTIIFNLICIANLMASQIAKVFVVSIDSLLLSCPNVAKFSTASADITDGGKLLILPSGSTHVPFMSVRKRRDPLVLDNPAILSALDRTYRIILDKYLRIFVNKHGLMLSLYSLLNN